MKQSTTTQEKKQDFYNAMETLETLTADAIATSTTIEKTRRLKRYFNIICEYAEKIQNEIF